jgi:hypothetical protein
MPYAYMYPDPTNANHQLGVMSANDQLWQVGSGPLGKGYVPEADYKMVEQPLAQGKDGDPAVMFPPDRSKDKGHKFRFYALGPAYGGNDPNRGGPITKDPRYPEGRDRILAHYRKALVTHGCIGYNDPGAQDALSADIKKGDNVIHVIFVKDEATARAMARSKVSNGAAVIHGEVSVVAGTTKNSTAHVTSPHDKNGQVDQGVNSIRVGKKKKPVGYVGARTTDKAKVTTGATNIYVKPDN